MKTTKPTYNTLILKRLRGGVNASVHNIVRFTPIPLLSLLLLLSCSKISLTFPFSSDSTTPADSTAWRRLQGFWSVEAVHFDTDTTFFAPDDPNFVEIKGNEFRQYYLVNAPKNFHSTPNRADLEEMYYVIMSLKAPATLLIDDLPATVTFSADSSRVTIGTSDRAWRAERCSAIKETKFDEVNLKIYY